VLGGLGSLRQQIPCMQRLHGVPMYIAIQLIMDLVHPGRRGASAPLHGALHGPQPAVYEMLQLRHKSE